MTFADVDALLGQMVASGATPGGAVAWSKAGQATIRFHGVTNSRTGRPVSEESTFPLGCIGKLLISIVAAQLMDEGRLDPDDEIADIRTASAGTARIRIKHVLSHTTGLREAPERLSRWRFGWDQYLAFMADTSPTFPAGDVWSYTQTAHCLLVKTIERIEGDTFDAVLEKRIWTPLGLTPGRLGFDEGGHQLVPHIRYENKPQLYPLRLPFDPGVNRYSISDLTLSAADFLKLGDYLLGQHARRSAHKHAPSGAAALFDKFVDIPRQAGGPMSEALPTYYTLGLGGYGDELFGHNGSFVGTTAALMISPRDHWVGFVGLNVWRHDLRDRLTGAMLSSLGRPYPALSRSVPLCVDLDEVPGHYAGLMMSANEVNVSPSLDAKIDLSIGTLDAKLQRNADGHLIVASGNPFLSVGFRRAPVSGAPVMYVGVSAFAKTKT